MSKDKNVKGLNKADLVNIIHERASQSKGALLKSRSEYDKFLKLVLDSISYGLKHHNKITLIGFGTFSVSNRKERMGHNPKTGKKMTIKAKKHPIFRAGKKLKDEIHS